MKIKLPHSFVILLSLFIVLSTMQLFAQSTVATYPTLTANNGTSAVTFEAVTTANINITEMTCAITTGTHQFQIWYRPGGVLHPSASLPSIIPANGWVLHGTVAVTSTSTTVPTTVVLNTPLNLPPGTYGFAVGGTTIVRYMTYNASLASTYTDGILTLNTGVGNGFGGAIPNPTFVTRSFVGSVTYELGIKGPNDAGISDIVSPGDTCEGNYNVDVEVTNYGNNKIDSVEIRWTYNGVAQPSVQYKNTLDTINGVGPSSAIVTLGSVNITANNFHDIVAWTRRPNNIVDTARRNDTSSVSVFGYSFPTINLGVDTTICPGEPITLNGGIRDSLRWSTNATNQSINVGVAGQYSIKVYENGCESRDTINVTSFPAAPAVNLGPDTLLCFNETILLDATAPGVTYLWQDNSTSATYLVDTTGVYSVVIEDANTCKSSDQVQVTYYDYPSVLLIVSPRNEICNQTPYTFRAFPSTTGSIMYQWKVNGTAVGAATTDPTFQGPLNYGDSVSVDLITDVCASTPYPVPSTKIEMILNPAPRTINGNTLIAENTTSTYVVPLSTTSSYVWRAIGGTINGDSTTNQVTINWGAANSNASVILEETDNGNCVRENELAVNVVSLVGIQKNGNIVGLGEAYPNPSSNLVTLPIFADGDWSISVELFDISGKLMKSIYNGTISGDSKIQFQVDDLTNGLYFCKLITADGYQTVKKLTVQK